MKRVRGNPGAQLVRCINPRRNIWRVCWDVDEEGYMCDELNHKPTTEEVRDMIVGWYNNQIEEEILGGMRYEGEPVWLSSENQFNYKALFDMAVQTNGSSLPATIKIGTDEHPIYRTFDDIGHLTDFYTKCMTHIHSALAEGWKRKDAIDWSRYDI